ncbi:aminotransferase class IV [Mucilaginibacter terrae]|uniref:branched-chain-amino-acid transaminase n=1 Tax=Mucilaginibacter terrae TaxID=1955052 RepID=A0ABU3GRJ2_9SPHI|nr:aminotransferase class IV [Mucilaginibacter terrae]MDT3402399.1 branched-chain amino acid aminotransferase [Mucilaginibacter terrae]
MMPLFLNFNGQLLAADSNIIPAGNRAFRYGDGLFESMRLMNGQLKFADLHAERLQNGMKALKLEGYSLLDSWFLKDKAEELATWNKTKNGRLRLTVYRDAGGLYTPEDNKSGWCLELVPDEVTGYRLNQKGLIMDVYTELTKPVNYLSNYKTCNSLPYVMAGLYKNQHKLDDVFLLNQQGFLCESISSNVFVWYDNHLYTPALSEGCIQGIMRKVIIDLCISLEIPITEAQINPDILHSADEVFITNSTKGIQWVIGFGIKRYFNGLSKTLIDELNKL